MWCFPNGNHVTCGLQVQQIRLRGGAGAPGCLCCSRQTYNQEQNQRDHCKSFEITLLCLSLSGPHVSFSVQRAWLLMIDLFFAAIQTH